MFICLLYAKAWFHGKPCAPKKLVKIIMSSSGSLKLVLEFGGGAELLFSNKKRHELQLPVIESTKWTIRKLLTWLKENLLTEREELFLQGDSVRPGILVLVNDTDWELLGELDYEIKENDNVLFISTLHGG